MCSSQIEFHIQLFLFRLYNLIFLLDFDEKEMQKIQLLLTAFYLINPRITYTEE